MPDGDAPHDDRGPFGVVIAVAGAVLAAVTLDFGGPAPWTAILFGIVCAGLLVRAVPPGRIPLPLLLGSEIPLALATGGLFGLQPNPGLGILLYLFAAYVGGTYPPRLSVPLAVLLGGSVAAVDLLTGPRDPATLWIGVSATATVWAGIAGRARRERTRTLEQLVEQSARTAASEARSSALAERARIARELHDVLAHTLSGAGMQLELADALLEAGRTEDARAAVQRARGAIAGGVTEARDAVHALRGDTVDLPAALAALGEGPRETVDAEPVRLGEAATLAVLRVAQEAFTNARRHAPGAPIRAALRSGPDGAVLTVANGPGRVASPSPGSGMGLIGMRERAAEAHGALRAGPAPDGGWAVTLTVPTEETRT
ncbi:sensor histidine kinase [Tsukamurella sp. 1534]|uniref:sensor histidine kinase n=1 Tax=Tsukamurella sp. 1534 TaxID=1151061 RepID=UPI0006ACE05C|nr:histidine kinase [Tsukamurella sp. 1534]